MKQILGLTKADAVEGGIKFDVVTVAGTVTYAVPTKDLGRIIQFLVAAASDFTDSDDQANATPPDDLYPIPASAIALISGKTASSHILAMKSGALWLGFEGDSETIAEQLLAASRFATIASPDGGKPN